jgi:hypothetical protein
MARSRRVRATDQCLLSGGKADMTKSTPLCPLMTKSNIEVANLDLSLSKRGSGQRPRRRAISARCVRTNV